MPSVWDQYIGNAGRASDDLGRGIDAPTAVERLLQSLGLSAGTPQAMGDVTTPAQREFAQGRQALLQDLLGRIPTSEERLEASRGQLAIEAGQASQQLVGNAVRRGLLHSGILAAEKAKLGRSLTEAEGRARLAAATGPMTDRAALLGLLAQDQPLPEVEVRQGDSGLVPLLTGIAGGVGGGVLGGLAGGPGGVLSGASTGFQAGSALGQAATAGQGGVGPRRRQQFVDRRAR